MIIEVHDQFGNPQRLQVSRVLISSDHGDPLALAVDGVRGRHWRVFRLGDADFTSQLQAHGIANTVILRQA